MATCKPTKKQIAKVNKAWEKEVKIRHFKCPLCGKIFARDMNDPISKLFLKKQGYQSYCGKMKKDCYAIPVLKKRKEKANG